MDISSIIGMISPERIGQIAAQHGVPAEMVNMVLQQAGQHAANGVTDPGQLVQQVDQTTPASVNAGGIAGILESALGQGGLGGAAGQAGGDGGLMGTLTGMAGKFFNH